MKAFRATLLILGLFFVNAALAGPVSHFGKLVVCGNNICGEKTGNSTPVFFKGPSLFWSDGDGAPYYRQEAVDWLVDNMQIGVIRAAMAIRYYGENSEEVNKAGGVWGYYFDKPKQKGLIKAVIDAAIENDIYVIVDWHSHVAHNETDLARTFFVEIANEYKDVPNIIWEVYNEPMGASEDQVNTYAKSIITALRGANNRNLVLVGSPSWSQKPNSQASKYGASSAQSDNVAFTFHFYAVTHPQSGGIGNEASSARTAGYAVFATEWGGTSADGDGNFESGPSKTWTDWLDQNKISSCMWSASAAKKKNNTSAVQASSIFKLTANPSNLSQSDLTDGSGSYFKGDNYMGKNKWTSQIPSSHPKSNDLTASVKDGSSVTLSSTQLGITGDITKVSFAPSSAESGSYEISSDKKSITYTPPASGSEVAQIRLIYETTQGSVVTQSRITINITERRPVVPEKPAKAVSRKASTVLNATSDLSISDPSGQGVEFTAASVEPSSVGTATYSGTNITFTPDPSQHTVNSATATLKYTVKSKSGPSNTGSIVLNLQNFAPTIRAMGGTYAPSYPNTAPIGIGMKLFSGADKDGDAIYFDKFYLHEQYPGTWEKVSPDSVVYTPDPTKTGVVTFLAVITDGDKNSPVGGLNITLTGNGTAIGDLPKPTQIPNYVPPEPPEEPEPPEAIIQFNAAKSIGIASLGFGKIQFYLASSGVAKLDVYSISGKKIGSLLNGHQNAGSKEVSLENLNLQKGVYILRLSQGSQVKTLKIVN